MLYDDSSGTVLEFGKNIFVGHEPDMPDECITVFDTGAYAPYLGLTNTGYEYPSVQVRVRSNNYRSGWAIIEKIKNSLHGLSQITYGGTLYSLIQCANGPALLDYDERNRCRFYINFNLQRR